MNEDFVFTKEEKVNKLFKVFNVLRNSLQCKRMVVGGSMAMYVHGFCISGNKPSISYKNRRCGCRHMGSKQNRLQQDCFLQ